MKVVLALLAMTVSVSAAGLDIHGVPAPSSKYLKMRPGIHTTLLPLNRVMVLCFNASGDGKAHPGCATLGPKGECFIIAPIGDRAIYQHELAHCNGWPEPVR